MDLVVYGAEWCRPCQQTKKQLDELQVVYSYVDLQEANPHSFKNIPVVTLEQNGIIVEKFTGFDLERLKQFIEKLG